MTYQLPFLETVRYIYFSNLTPRNSGSVHSAHKSVQEITETERM
jgi:hypothetical protein